MKNNWHGLLKILEIELLDSSNNVLWRDENLYNILHTEGEEFILDAIFAGGAIPLSYFFGLDNRATPTAGDTLETVSGTEPEINGYLRQLVASNAFNVQLINGVNNAIGPIATFSASGGSWGPVKNFFLSTSADNNGKLMATVTLNNPITVDDGNSINIRMGLALKDCPA